MIQHRLGGLYLASWGGGQAHKFGQAVVVELAVGPVHPFQERTCVAANEVGAWICLLNNFALQNHIASLLSMHRLKRFRLLVPGLSGVDFHDDQGLSRSCS